MSRNNWTEEEIEILKKDYHKGLVKIVSILNRHTRSSIQKKAKSLNLKVDVNNLYYDIDYIKEIVESSNSFSDVIRNMGKSKSGDSYRVIKRFIERNKIDYSHFNPWKNNKGNNKRSINIWLKSGTYIHSTRLKDRLYKEGLKNRQCEICGQGEDWNGNKMSLILDHINGINTDNRIENLQIVCPNCNATLDTHCRGRKGLLKDTKKIQNNLKVNISKSLSKRKSTRPPYKQLLEEIKLLGYTKTGKKYNVSDNSIRKWVKMYEKYGVDF